MHENPYKSPDSVAENQRQLAAWQKTLVVAAIVAGLWVVNFVGWYVELFVLTP